MGGVQRETGGGGSTKRDGGWGEYKERRGVGGVQRETGGGGSTNTHMSIKRMKNIQIRK